MGHMLDDRREIPDTSGARVSRVSKWGVSFNTAAPRYEGTEKELEPYTATHPQTDVPICNVTWFHAFSDIPCGLMTPESLS